jgi:hypothetical protein
MLELSTILHSFHHILSHSTKSSLIYACNDLWDVRFQVIYVDTIPVVDIAFEMTPQKEIWWR